MADSIGEGGGYRSMEGGEIWRGEGGVVVLKKQTCIAGHVGARVCTWVHVYVYIGVRVCVHKCTYIHTSIHTSALRLLTLASGESSRHHHRRTGEIGGKQTIFLNFFQVQGVMIS